MSRGSGLRMTSSWKLYQSIVFLIFQVDRGSLGDVWSPTGTVSGAIQVCWCFDTIDICVSVCNISLSHTHKFMVFFRNRTSLPAVSANPTTYSVSDTIVAFTPAPTPHSHSSLSHTHKFMGFFRNRTTLQRDPCGSFGEDYDLQCFRQDTSIHSDTHPTFTLLVISYTQVHGFFP